jgi:hypothetical protein
MNVYVILIVLIVLIILYFMFAKKNTIKDFYRFLLSNLVLL